MQCLSSAAHLGWHESRDIPNRAAGEPTLTAGGLLVAPILVANTMRWNHGRCKGPGGFRGVPAAGANIVVDGPVGSQWFTKSAREASAVPFLLPASSAQGLLRLCCSSPPRTGYERGGKGPSVWHLHTTRCQDRNRPARRKAPLCAPGSAPMGAQWSTQQDEASACQAKAKGMGRGCIHQGHSRPASCALQTRPDGGQRLQHSPAATHPNTRNSAPQKQHSGQEFRDVHIRDGRITPWSVSIAAPQSLGVVAQVSTEKEGMEMGHLRVPGRGRL